MPLISLIVCNCDGLDVSRALQMFGRALPGEEILAITGVRGIAEGYNLGIERASGEWLIFAHRDIEILSADFLERLTAHMPHADVIGVAGTSRIGNGAWVSACPPYVFGQIAQPEAEGYSVWNWGTPSRRVNGIKALDGVFLCVRRAVAKTLQFDAVNFPAFDGYDMDFTFRAWRAGHRLTVGCDLAILHQSTGRWGDDFLKYERVFSAKHADALDPLPMGRTFQVGITRCQTRDELLEIMRPEWVIK